MLQNEFSANRGSTISQRSSRLDSLNEYDKISLKLRETLFMREFVGLIKKSKLDSLSSMIEILNTLTLYSSYNERDFERADGYMILQSILLEFKDDSPQLSLPSLDTLFNQIFIIICPQRSRIKNFNGFKLLLNIIE
jgi:hypothetical protein